MNNWFECKVKFDKTGDDGLIKTVTESYLVDALSFTEAEERITREMKPFISGDFVIDSVVRRKIAEMIDSDDLTSDKWYKAKVNFVLFDDEKMIEKKIGNTMFVKASDFKEALERLLEAMKGTLADYEVHTISETAIMDAYYYEAPAEEEKE